jgi:hypothetical protein
MPALEKEILVGKTEVQVPATLDEMVRSLGGLERLLTATQWERAAIVYAFTTPSQGKRADLSPKREKWPMAFADFAALKIKGLGKPDTVAEYHAAWQRAVDAGWTTKAKPGKTVLLPSQAWSGRQDTDGQRRYADVSSPAAITKAAVTLAATDPEFARAVAKGVGEAQPTEAMKGVLEGRENTAVGQREKHQREAAARFTADGKRRNQDARYMEVDNLIGKAYRALKEALGVDLSPTEEMQDLLMQDLDALQAVLDLVRLKYVEAGDVDWDAELAKITGGEA